MLSEREAMALRDIARRLSADDPGFAARMLRTLPRRPPRGLRLVQDLVITVALVLAVIYIALAEVGSAFALALFACVVFGLWRARSRPGPHRRFWPGRWASRRD
jgi:hypothetical protein